MVNNNAGEELCFTDNQGTIVDIVKYEDQYPWPLEPDGDGPTLELIDPSMDNNTASSWRASELKGGTPGKINHMDVGKSYLVYPDFEFYPAWPNPFTTKTSFRYSVFEDCNVTLKIFNSYGHEVDCLVNEQHQPGMYEHDWEPEHLGSGIYIVCFSTGKFRQNRKLLYLKKACQF